MVDPIYASEALPPTYQAVPANNSVSCPANVITFNPGYYDDAISLTALMTGGGPCGGSTWWFKPGTYYFDFHDNTNDLDVYKGSGTATNSGADQWAITSGHLMAGTPTDSSGNVIASPSACPDVPRFLPEPHQVGQCSWGAVHLWR
jgi:hypothetical protein